VAAAGFHSSGLVPAARAAVLQVLKAGHDTVKNSISKIR